MRPFRLPPMWGSVFLLYSCTTSMTAKISPENRNGTARGTCFAAYEKAKETNSKFVGYGTGIVDAIAVEAANQDLGRQIRTHVESQSSIQENNLSATYEAVSGSKVNELLVGLVVEKRCEDLGRFEAVVSLTKQIFLTNLSQILDSLANEASTYQLRIMQSETRAKRLNYAVEAMKYLSKERAIFSDTVNLCLTFGGCSAIKKTAFQELESVVLPEISRHSFYVEAKNTEASYVIKQIETLLSYGGILTSSSPENAHLVSATCFRKDFPQLSGTDYMITEISCSANLTVDGEIASSKKFIGKGVGESRDAALEAARVSMGPAESGH